jgi:hypothetical protein
MRVRLRGQRLAARFDVAENLGSELGPLLVATARHAFGESLAAYG